MFNTEYFDDEPPSRYTQEQLEFIAHLDKAAQIVSTWPIWKQNIIRDSLSPTVRVPREHVNNNPDDDCF